jgi:hypothetical protein
LNRLFRSGSYPDVRRQISQFGSGGFYELLDPRSLVARQIVHNDDVALRERGSKAFLHPVLEQSGVDRPVESLRHREAGKAQASDQRDRLVMSVRNGGAQALPPPAASAFARQIGGSPGLIDEKEFRRIEVSLPCEPVPALLQDVRALLLLGVCSLF